MGKTGYKSFASLEQYYVYGGAPTGVVKPNNINDPDYIAPVLDVEACSPTPKYYNAEVKATATKNNCSPGKVGNSVTLTAFANQFVSEISIDDANSQAEAWLAANVQLYANNLGICTLTQGKSFHIQSTGFDSIGRQNVSEIKYDSLNDKIYVGGDFITYNNVSEYRLIRLNSDGTKDTSFNIGSGFNGTVCAILCVGTKIYVGGLFTTYNGVSSPHLIRLNSDGSIDTSFQIGTTGFDDWVYALAYDTLNNKVYVGGDFTTFQNMSANRLICLDVNGNKDSTFNINTGFDRAVHSLHYDVANNKLYVGGGFTTFQGITAKGLIRLNTNGNKDLGFNLDSGFDCIVLTITYDISNNKLYAGGGSVSPTNTLTRLNLNGTIDSTFNIGTGFNSTVSSILLSNDKIYVAGDFSTYKDAVANCLIRLNSNGTADSTFNIGTGFDNETEVLCYNTSANKLFVGGGFTSYNEVSGMNKIICLNSDGSSNTDIV